MAPHPYNMYYEKLLPALISKVEELRIFHYETADVPMLWQFLLRKKWAKSEEQPLSKLVADVFAVKSGEFSSFLQFNERKTEALLTDQDVSDLFQAPVKTE